MPYLVHALDKPDHTNVRAVTRPTHLEYLDAHKDELLFAGALLNDDGSVAHGSIYILKTDDRAEAEAFIANDPFTQAGLFKEVTVTRQRVAFLNGERLI